MAVKRRPSIRQYSVPASAPGTEIVLPTTTVAFVIRSRTAGGLQIALSGVESNAFFSLGSAESYTEEELCLDEPLKLRVTGAAAGVVEVWSWEG